MNTHYIYIYTHTIICEKKMQQIIHRPNTQCHGYANGCLGWYPVVADRLVDVSADCCVSAVCACSPVELLKCSAWHTIK